MKVKESYEIHTVFEWHLDRLSNFSVRRSKDSQCFSVGGQPPKNCSGVRLSP